MYGYHQPVQGELEDENEIIQKCKDGDLEAMSLLAGHYLPKVFRRVWLSVPADDAEDVTQEIFLNLIGNIKTFRGGSKFSTWLYTITNRKIADYYRKEKKKKMDMSLSAEQIDAKLSAIGIANRDTEVINRMIAVRTGFAKLPEQYKEVLILRLVDGLSFKKVSTKIGISYEATKSLFRRAISSLRKEIGEN